MTFAVPNLDPANGRGCLDAGDVASLVGGRLPDDERSILVAHLAGCGACRDLVGAVAAAAPETEPEGLVHRVPRARWIATAAAIAAVALAAVGGILAFGPSRGTGATTDFRERVAIAARQAGVELLDDAALEARAFVPERGTLAVLQPRGASLDGRPEIAWSGIPSGSTVHVTVRDDQGVVRLDEATDLPTLPWPTSTPSLVEGATYVARVAAARAAGGASATAAFRVATLAERAAYEALVGRIPADTPGDVRAMVAAHAALRAGLSGEAARALLDAARHGAPRSELERLGRVLGPASPGDHR